MNHPLKRQPQAGISLIELMISTLLGLILLGGVLELFVHSRQSLQLQESYARMQENARFALDHIAHEIRLAGSGLCIAPTPLANAITGDSAPWTLDLSQPLTGFEGNSQFSLWSKHFNRVYKNTDALVINRANPTNEWPIQEQSTSIQQTTFSLENTHTFKEGTVLLARDRNCTQQGLFVLSSPNTNANKKRQLTLLTGAIKKSPLANCTTQLFGDFDCNLIPPTNPILRPPEYADGVVQPLASSALYLRPGSDGKTPGLYQKRLNGQVEELVSGIENLQFFYGIDDNNDQQVDQLLTAAEVKNWQTVKLVQIHLLARSLNERGDQVSRYQFLGKELHSNDRFLRQAFTQTVHLRN